MNNSTHDYYRHYPRWQPSAVVIRRAGRAIVRTARSSFHGRLLDIGCGAGWKRHLVEDFIEAYIGMDMLSTLHERTGIDVFGSARRLPFRNSSMDAILCTSVLEHLTAPDEALGEAFRVLKPGGSALYTIPLFWHIHEKPRDFYRFTRFALERLFDNAGFIIERIEPLSGFWVTFGSEWDYYWNAVLPFPLSLLAKGFAFFGSFIIPLFDRLDRLFNKAWSDWTWMYMVVARKPGQAADHGSNRQRKWGEAES